jgi:hypothetical protein
MGIRGDNMAWQTPKTNWDTHPKAIEPEDLNRIEGNIKVVREQISIPLRAEVVDSFPPHAAGQIIYHTGHKRAYVSDGSAWVAVNIEGDADVEHVLAGKTFSSRIAGVGAVGTMPNRAAVVITPGTSNKAIPAGYHNGEGYVVGDSNLKAENIKKGVSIFGVNGSFLHALYSYGTEYVPWVTGYSTGSGASQSKESDHLYFYLPEGRDTERTYVTDEMINLSNVLALIVEWEGLSEQSSGSAGASKAYEPYLVVGSTKTGSGTSGVTTFLRGSWLMKFPRTIEILKVSSLTGNYYIRIHGRCRNTLGEDSFQRKIYYVGLVVK